jgi:hypothetical protein
MSMTSDSRASGTARFEMLNRFLYRRDQRPKLRAWLTLPGVFTEAGFERFKNSGIGSDMGRESNHLGDPKVLQQILTLADKRYRVHDREAVAHLDHPKRVYDLTGGLTRRRYTDEHIRLIRGENWRPVLTGVWGKLSLAIPP